MTDEWGLLQLGTANINTVLFYRGQNLVYQ